MARRYNIELLFCYRIVILLLFTVVCVLVCLWIYSGCKLYAYYFIIFLCIIDMYFILLFFLEQFIECFDPASVAGAVDNSKLPEFLNIHNDLLVRSRSMLLMFLIGRFLDRLTILCNYVLIYCCAMHYMILLYGIGMF